MRSKRLYLATRRHDQKAERVVHLVADTGLERRQILWTQALAKRVGSEGAEENGQAGKARAETEEEAHVSFSTRARRLHAAGRPRL